VLVCLCSKNEEPDVWRVFDTRPELGLRRDRVVAAMINWLPKSQNLRTLAGRLNLGLDSFVFLDDNPVECAEVRANCPEVLTIEWPHDSDRALRLLDHIWEFDPGRSTKEDARRTELYKEEFRRQEARAETLTFEDFIKSLGLEVDFAPLSPDDLRRSAQLTLRTNQFNFTTIRREEADLQALVAAGRHEIRTVRVRDRFGDYGLVGLVIAERGADAWALDTFLLSCRVLGRGVEHQILADLGTMAATAGAASVTLRLETTARNTPARAFLESVIPDQWREGDDRGVRCDVPAPELASVRFEPAVTGEVVVQEEGGSKSSQPLDVSRLRRREEQIVRAAFSLATGRDVLARSRGAAAPATGERDAGRTTPAPAAAVRDDVARTVYDAFASALRVTPEQVATVDRLESLGCDSLRIVEITVALSETYPWLPSTLLFEHRAVSQIVDEIVRLAQPAAAGAAEPRPAATPAAAAGDVAVVGMSVRCAGAATLDEFWSLLAAGATAVKPVPADRPHFLHRLQDSRPHWAGLLDDVAGFDPEFFGVSPREAAVMDPQLRLFLEVAWGALEDAGAAGAQHDPQTGVFAGVMYGDYGFRANLGEGVGLYRCWEGFSLANRLSQLLGFHGPSLAVDTACSSSGTALHLACQALKAGDCRVALVGGVNLILDPDRFGSLGRLGILSARGRCEPFGADADGTVLGEGAGVVVLRPLEDALRRGDRIYGVIKGTGVSTGSGTVGFTAPNPQAQSQAVRRSVEAARIDPRTISYVETHGTGTSLGDPIEVRGLSLGYGVTDADADGGPRCALGSIKPNIGHLEAGAAVLGLIKVLLQLQHKQLVPSITSVAPNPQIPFERLPFRVQRALEAWDAPSPRRAGLNSFGVGGANAHVIIEEAPAAAEPLRTSERPLHVLALSAPSIDALTTQSAAMAAYLTDSPGMPLADFCYSVNTGRRHFEQRRAIVAGDVLELQRGVASLRTAGRDAGGAVPPKPKVAFLFTGQGSQYAGMGRRLYATQPVFREALDRCAEVFDRLLGRRLIDLLFAEAGSEAGELLNQTGYTQPALFAFEYALAQLWRSWGIRPDIVMGHSVGEIAAMCVAGGVSLEDGLKLIAARGRLMQELPAGGVMTSVMADEARVLEAIESSRDMVAIAAVNAPGQVVISGAGAAVAEIAARLTADGIKTKPLTVSHAFHSPLMKPMLARYAEVVREIRFAEPEVPFVSCVDGRFVTTELTSPDYWLRQVMDPVRFAAGTAVLEDAGVTAFVEIGPHPVLLGMARQSVRRDDAVAWLPSLRRDADEWRTLMSSLGSLYERGADVDWDGFDAPYSRTRVPAPTYAFAHTPYWLKLGTLVQTAPLSSGRRPQRYEIDWRAAALAAPQGDLRGRWLLFADRGGLGRALATELERGGGVVTLVAPEQMDPTSAADYERVLRDGAAGNEPLRVVHLWSVDAQPSAALDEGALESATDRGVISAALLAQTLAGAGVHARLWIVTAAAVPDDSLGEASAIAQSPVWGLGRTIALEHPELWGGLIDAKFDSAAAAAAAIAGELAAKTPDDQVALRPDARRVPRLVARTWRERPPRQLSSDGSYLITGGTGAIGLRMAEWLVDRGARHVVLVSRRGDTDERTRAAIDALSKRGAEVRVAACDVSRAAEVDALLSGLAGSGQPLRGLVHAAGVDEAIPLAQLTADDIRRVLAAKVAGGWVLHDRTRALALDLFVLCSSMAAVLGAQGRAHYAAANAFLDALAHERRRQGLEATSINWGPWKGGGMAGAEQLEQFERIGNHGLDPAQAMWALGEIAEDDAAQVVVADIDWPRFRVAYEARRPRPLVADMGSERVPQSTGAAAAGAPWASRLVAVDAEQRGEALSALLQREVADTMGFDDAAKVPLDRDFYELGMDSLMMAELVGRLKQHAGTTAGALVFDHPTVRALSSKLLERLVVENADTSAAATPAGAEAPHEGVHGYRDDDAGAIDAFHAAAWPRRRRDLIPSRWRWMFLESARRVGVDPRIWLYEADAQLAGHMGAIAVRVKVGDEERNTAWLVDTMVLDSYRQKGVGPRLMVRAHEDLPFALSLGQTSEMRELQLRLGWRSVAPLQTAQLLIRPEQVLEGKLPKPAAMAASWGLRATSAVRDMVKGRVRASSREVDVFGPCHDELWAAMAPTVTCGVVRNASYLNWKYVEQPGQTFLRLEVLEGNAVRGVAIVMFREPDEDYRYRRAFLVDVVAPLTDAAALTQVVQAAVDAAAARGADAMVCLHIGRALTRALGDCGFVMRQPERFLLVDPAPLSGRALEHVLSPDAWFVTQGDSDIDRPW
jgi:malonyl CoA-acyl carrier protein transacylase